MSQRTAPKKGFSLVELVIVLSVISVLAAVAIPRFVNSDSTLLVQAHGLARDLRHIQAIAMNQGRTLNFNIQSVSSYRVAFSGSTIIDPATMQPYSVTLGNNVTLSGADTQIDSMGRPVASGSLLATERVFTLSSNTRTTAVTMSPVTGFVAVSP